MTAQPADGVVIVDKPAGLTSHDVVARVRRLAGTRRVGHAGTLDPMATGVLVVGIGRATRLLGHLAATTKVYDATIRLGVATTTDDAEGAEAGGAPAGELTEDAVREAAAAFVGPLLQVPSSVSAIKVAGQRAYARVRAGEDVELAARPVTVHAFDVTKQARQDDCLDVDVSVTCSTGTYVRALARDLGAQLEVGGHLTRLRRSAVGPFTLAAARTLDELAEHWQVLDLTTVATSAFATFRLERDQAVRVRHGARLVDAGLPAGGGPVAMIDPDGVFLALYARGGDADTAVPVAVFVG